MFSDNKHSLPRLLIIEDDPDFSRNLKMGLEQQQYAVDIANNGASALECLGQYHYRIALCDMNLPDMNGVLLLEKMLRRDTDLQVIMITGNADVKTAVECMKKGAIDYLVKPFLLSHLSATLERVIKQNELRHMVAVYKASQTIFRSSGLENLFAAVSDLCRRTLRVDNLCIALKNSADRWYIAASNGPASSLYDIEFARRLQNLFESSSTATPHVFLQERSRISEVFGSEFSEVSQQDSCINHALLLDGRILGAISVFRCDASEPFVEADVRCLSILCSNISQAVGNANLYEQLEKKVKELKAAKEKLELAQQQVIHSEKMAAIGQMAAGVAHELNNPLSGILGFAQLLLANPDVSSQQREDLETIEAQARRCKTIIRNLLELSRTQKPNSELVDLVPHLRSTLHLVTYEFMNAGIELEVRLPDSLPLIYGDAHQLQQVFINLITNARHALEGHPHGRLIVSSTVSNDALCLCFEDNGTGILPDVLQKIFDPFFTTKPAGKGTGLGLSICRSIIEEHQGQITVDSTPGKGTRFTVSLPLKVQRVAEGLVR